MLSTKPNLETGGLIPFYSVIGHPSLPGRIIKACGDRVLDGQLLLGPNDDRQEMTFFAKEEGLFRIAMAERIKVVARKQNLDLVVPKKHLVAYADTTRATSPTQKYCVVVEKLDNLLSPEETVRKLNEMPESEQRATAQKITALIREAGIIDTSFHNIRLTTDGKLAIIDTEPAGLMKAQDSGLTRQSSVEKAARIGLFMLNNHLQPEAGLFTINITANLTPFMEEVSKAYDEACQPARLSKWKIALSVVTLGIFPLIVLIASFAYSCFARCRFACNLIGEDVEGIKDYLDAGIVYPTNAGCFSLLCPCSPS